MPRRALSQSLAALSARLQSRHPEIERATLTRIYAISDPGEALDPEYVVGLRAAVRAALDYGLAAVESNPTGPRPPPVLLTQARLAARNDVSLDTVLRRYFAGYTLFGDFLMQEAENGDLSGGAALKRVLHAHATLFDHLLAAVAEEYTREAEARLEGAGQRRAERIERLLAGELLDTSELRYDFDAHHLAAIVTGPRAADATRKLAKALDRRLLLVHRGRDTVWAWLGGRRRLDPAELTPLLAPIWPVNASLALGEPAEGLAGWRLTHHQARAALPIALHSPQPFTRYADVALLASILQDDLLATSLRELYLAPLEAQQRGDGETLRETLRAYIVADRNVSSAAAALGVSRNTVANRLRAVEQRLERPLSACVTELEIALGLEELDVPPTLPNSLANR